MPNLVGLNAEVATDELHKLGFFKFTYEPVDPDMMVIVTREWRVKEQSEKPGTVLSLQAPIVLFCEKIA